MIDVLQVRDHVLLLVLWEFLAVFFSRGQGTHHNGGRGDGNDAQV